MIVTGACEEGGGGEKEGEEENAACGRWFFDEWGARRDPQRPRAGAVPGTILAEVSGLGGFGVTIFSENTSPLNSFDCLHLRELCVLCG
jgi:hypothetical protein